MFTPNCSEIRRTRNSFQLRQAENRHVARQIEGNFLLRGICLRTSLERGESERQIVPGGYRFYQVKQSTSHYTTLLHGNVHIFQVGLVSANSEMSLLF